MEQNTNERQFFVAIVAGKDHAETMNGFDDSKLTDEPYVVYRYKDAAKIRANRISFLEKLINHDEFSGDDSLHTEARASLEAELDYIRSLDDTDFYLLVTESYDIDEKTGDAVTRKNPNGKFSYHRMGENFSYPFILKDGSLSYSTRKGDIAWDKVHRSLGEAEKFAATWEMVIDGRKPMNEEEEKIFRNMQSFRNYLLSFKTKETYIVSNTSFWAHAFVNDGKWTEYDGTGQLPWMTGFFDRFIAPLHDDTLLTIYECKR